MVSESFVLFFLKTSGADQFVRFINNCKPRRGKMGMKNLYMKFPLIFFRALCLCFLFFGLYVFVVMGHSYRKTLFDHGKYYLPYHTSFWLLNFSFFF